MTSTAIKIFLPAGTTSSADTARALWQAFRDRLEISRQRRQLASLTVDQLRDIGITRNQARAESVKTFWQD